LIMGLCIWYEWRLKGKKKASQTAINGGLDVVTLQKQNETRLRALQSLLPANSNADGANEDWRSQAPLAHPIWREHRRRLEVKLRADGYSERAIQLASESGYEDSIFPDASTSQWAERTCTSAARIREYTSQQIQEEVTRQRDFAYLAPASEATTAVSHAGLSQGAYPAISQATSQPANRSRFSQWLMHRILANGRNEAPAALCPPTSPSHMSRNRSGQLIRLSPRTSKHSRNASHPSSVPAERVLRPEEYTANDRIHYMVRVASEEQRRMD
jgi:hypothetical protein